MPAATELANQIDLRMTQGAPELVDRPIIRRPWTASADRICFENFCPCREDNVSPIGYILAGFHQTATPAAPWSILSIAHLP